MKPTRVNTNPIVQFDAVIIPMNSCALILNCVLKKINQLGSEQQEQILLLVVMMTIMRTLKMIANH